MYTTLPRDMAFHPPTHTALIYRRTWPRLYDASQYMTPYPLTHTSNAYRHIQPSSTDGHDLAHQRWTRRDLASHMTLAHQRIGPLLTNGHGPSSTDGHDLDHRLTRLFPKTRHSTHRRIQPTLPMDPALAHQRTRHSSTDGYDLAHRLTQRFPKTRRPARRRIQPTTHRRMHLPTDIRSSPTDRHSLHPPTDTTSPNDRFDTSSRHVTYPPTDTNLARQRTRPPFIDRHDASPRHDNPSTDGDGPRPPIGMTLAHQWTRP
jgi:hypothetical protein